MKKCKEPISQSTSCAWQMWQLWNLSRDGGQQISFEHLHCLKLIPDNRKIALQTEIILN